MPSQDLEQFCREVLLDPSLQGEVRGLGSSDDFIERVVGLGAERGFEFSAADVKDAMRAGYSVWLVRWI